MEQHDTAVAAEGFRQAQAANKRPFTQAHCDPWLEKFMANAREAFGIPVQKSTMSGLIQELEQLGYFGYAHFLAQHVKCGETVRTRRNMPKDAPFCRQRRAP
jgi:hypothetical protein